MNVLLLLWLCGHLFVRYSHGYVGRSCNNRWDCQRDEFCYQMPPWGRYSICVCDPLLDLHEVGGEGRKHCARYHSNNCVYDEDCRLPNQSQSIDERLYCDPVDYYTDQSHQCKCSGPLYYISPEVDHYECVLHWGMYVGVAVAVLMLF